MVVAITNVKDLHVQDGQSVKSVRLSTSEASTPSDTKTLRHEDEEEGQSKVFVQNASVFNVLKKKIFGKGEYDASEISLTRRYG